MTTPDGRTASTFTRSQWIWLVVGVVGLTLLGLVAVNAVRRTQATQAQAESGAWAGAPADGACYGGGLAQTRADVEAGGVAVGGDPFPVDCADDRALYVVVGHVDRIENRDHEPEFCAAFADVTDTVWYDPFGLPRADRTVHDDPTEVSSAGPADLGTLVCLQEATG